MASPHVQGVHVKYSYEYITTTYNRLRSNTNIIPCFPMHGCLITLNCIYACTVHVLRMYALSVLRHFSILILIMIIIAPQMTKLLLPKMLEKRNGLIVNLSSGSSKLAPPMLMCYATTKVHYIIIPTIQPHAEISPGETLFCQ